MAYDDQVSYQIRAEWGVEGLNRLAPTDVIVVVDPLRFSTTVTDRVAAGERIYANDEIISASINGAPVALAAAKTSALVLVGSLRNAQAVADAIIELQNERQARTSVAIIAGGERVGEAGALRFAVEDQLAAGAIISSLSDRGFDHTAPEAAVMGESFRALTRAVTHLFLASATGRKLVEQAHRDQVVNASQMNVVSAVATLRDGVFRAL